MHRFAVFFGLLSHFGVSGFGLDLVWWTLLFWVWVWCEQITDDLKCSGNCHLIFSNYHRWWVCGFHFINMWLLCVPKHVHLVISNLLFVKYSAGLSCQMVKWYMSHTRTQSTHLNISYVSTSETSMKLMFDRRSSGSAWAPHCSFYGDTSNGLHPPNHTTVMLPWKKLGFMRYDIIIYNYIYYIIIHIIMYIYIVICNVANPMVNYPIHHDWEWFCIIPIGFMIEL